MGMRSIALVSVFLSASAVTLASSTVVEPQPVQFCQYFRTVDFAGSQALNTPASGAGVVLLGQMNNDGTVLFNADEPAYAELDTSGQFSVTLPPASHERYAMVIVWPDAFTASNGFPVHLDMLRLDPSPVEPITHILSGPTTQLDRLKDLAVDNQGVLQVNAQIYGLPTLAGSSIRVGRLDQTTTRFWNSRFAHSDEPLGGHGLYLPSPVSTMALESGNLFTGIEATGTPTSFAVFDADTGTELAAGSITSARPDPFVFQFSIPVQNICVIYYGQQPITAGQGEPPLGLTTSGPLECFGLAPSHCELIQSGCDIYYEIVSGTETCAEDGNGGYLPPPANGALRTVRVCRTQSSETSQTVTYQVVDSNNVAISLPIPGAPTKVTLNSTKTSTTTSTQSNSSGTAVCIDYAVPYGTVLVHTYKWFWCKWECGYCIGNDPSYTCYIGTETYPRKKHFQTNASFSGYEHLGFMSLNCDAFTPGNNTNSEACE
jgi:hypothetical protein